MELGEEEEFDVPVIKPQVKEDDEYEYEYEDESEEDQGTAFALRHRPIFVPKVGYAPTSSIDSSNNRSGS